MPVETGMISDEDAEQMAAGGPPPAGVIVPEGTAAPAATVPQPAAAVATPAPDVQRHPETPQVDAPAPQPTAAAVSPTEVLDSNDVPVGPPPEVGGLDVLTKEQEAQQADTHPKVTIRGEATFRLRRKIPGMLLLKLTKTQVEVTRPAAEGDPVVQAEAMAASYDAMVKLVVENEREAFVRYCEDAEPELEMSELMQDVLKAMMEAVTGRPTPPASA